MLVFELADRPYPVKKVYDGDEEEIYTFVTDHGQEYKIAFVLDADIDYSIGDNPPLDNHKVTVEFANTSHHPKMSTMSATGTGDAFRVFATVAHTTKQYVKKIPNVVEVNFSGATKEPARIKLYDSLAKVISRYLPEFYFAKRKEAGTYVEYFFRHKTRTL